MGQTSEFVPMSHRDLFEFYTKIYPYLSRLVDEIWKRQWEDELNMILMIKD